MTEKTTEELFELVRQGLPYQSGWSNGVPVWTTYAPSVRAQVALDALKELHRRLGRWEELEEWGVL